MRKILVSVVLALMLVVSAAVPAFAASTDTVDVTATPAIISIANLPTDWTMNDSGATAAGDDAIRSNSTYYSNDADNTAQPSSTVAAGECRFTVTNDGTVSVDIEIAMPNFSSGHAMPNSDTGSRTATDFGARAYVSGDSFPGPAITVAGTADVITGLASAGTQKWGLAIETRSDAFTDQTSMTSQVLLTATETP